MSLQRFRLLLRCMRFDLKETRSERKALDKLAPILSFSDAFMSNCKNGYHMSEFVTVDEMLPAFRGRCSFRQYIPSKPNKYAIKVFALCDARIFYTSKLEVYLGIDKDFNSSSAVVLRLLHHILESGRNLTIDNWFTSLSLVETLAVDHNITTIGTIKNNTKVLPLKFTKPVHRPVSTSMFGFRKMCTLVSHIPKKKKNVLLLSSFHHDDEIDKETGDANKPDYNRTKGGVDVVDKLCASYDCFTKTRRWPTVIFSLALNIAGINSQVIYHANNPNENILRRNFLKDIANKLIMPRLHERAHVHGLPSNLKSRLVEICGIPFDENDNFQQKAGRCNFCGTKKNRKTRFSCCKCGKFIHAGAPNWYMFTMQWKSTGII